MLRNLIGLSVVTALAGLIALTFRLMRRKQYPDFSGWWDAEGMPVFLIVWFIIGALFFVAFRK